jgi:hypothetical protein
MKLDNYILDWEPTRVNEDYFFRDLLIRYRVKDRSQRAAVIADHNRKIYFDNRYVATTYKGNIHNDEILLSKDFDTIEEAKAYADKILSDRGYITFPKHLHILL